MPDWAHDVITHLRFNVGGKVNAIVMRPIENVIKPELNTLFNADYILG